MFQSVYQSFLNYVSFIKFTDIIDILIVAYIIYHALVLIRDTRAIQLLKGIVIIIIVLQISYWADLHALNYIIGNTMQVGVLAVLILFQPELRRALEQMGRSSIGKWFNFDQNANLVKTKMIGELARASDDLAKTKTGALIVVERETRIGEIVATGTVLDADISAELLENIFVPNTPLHDGAVVIREGKILAAGCFLPLSQNPNLSKELGTRHRAGLGISEESDSVVVVVSEETGRISLAIDGDLTVGLSNESLVKLLTKHLEPERQKKFKKNIRLWKKK